MEQLLNGRFEYEVPKLTLSDTQINLTTNEGENVRGELYVAAEDNRRIKGMTMSSNRRILLAKEKFSGTTVCIPYGLDVKGLSAGETVDAVITFIHQRTLRNLFHFQRHRSRNRTVSNLIFIPDIDDLIAVFVQLFYFLYCHFHSFSLPVLFMTSLYKEKDSGN